MGFIQIASFEAEQEVWTNGNKTRGQKLNRIFSKKCHSFHPRGLTPINKNLMKLSWRSNDV